MTQCDCHEIVDQITRTYKKDGYKAALNEIQDGIEAYPDCINALLRKRLYILYYEEEFDDVYAYVFERINSGSCDPGMIYIAVESAMAAEDYRTAMELADYGVKKGDLSDDYYYRDTFLLLGSYSAGVLGLREMALSNISNMKNKSLIIDWIAKHPPINAGRVNEILQAVGTRD